MIESESLMQNKKVPVVSIVLYVLAGLLLIYSVWSAVYSSKILSDAIAMGQLVFKGSEFEVVSFFMSNLALYLLFAVVLFALGWILQIITPVSLEEADSEIEIITVEETMVDEFDEVFPESDSEDTLA